MEMPDRFSKLILMNTALGTGEGVPSPGFKAFRDWVNKTPDMDVGRLMLRGTPILNSEELRAYNAPFPDITYKAGVRRFPNLLPTMLILLCQSLKKQEGPFQNRILLIS